jgi:hypothetical protein
MTEQERNDLIEECAKAAEAAVNRAREEGESDLRGVRSWVTSAIRELKAKA